MTAPTITDAMIRELRQSIISDIESAGEAGVRIDAREFLVDCNDALNPDLDEGESNEARARCAEILSARMKEGK